MMTIEVAGSSGMSMPRRPCTALPPGFRFHPTDEELIVHYLRKRAAAAPCPAPVIADVDIYKLDPWELPGKAVFGEGEWYFFSPRDRKYPNGVRPNRAAGSGYWKATGTDKPITALSGAGEMIGVKKALVFYKGRPPKGTKTSWIMHEYRLAAATTYRLPVPDSSSSSMRLDDWVLCRIYKRSSPPLFHHSMPSSSMELDDGHHQQDVDVVASCSRPMPKPPSISDYLVDDLQPEPAESSARFLMDDSNAQYHHTASNRPFLQPPPPINAAFSIFGPSDQG